MASTSSRASADGDSGVPTDPTPAQSGSSARRGPLEGVRAAVSSLRIASFGLRPNLALALLGHGLALAVTTAVFLILNRRFYYNPIGYDEGFFVWGGWSITKGLAPYRDFIEFKPPMVFITHALAQILFGLQDGGYRKFFTIFPLVSVLLFQLSLVGRKAGRVFALAVTLAIVPLFLSSAYHDTALSDCEAIGFAYYLLGIAFSIWEGRYQKATTVAGGFFLSCCAMSKEPFAPMVVFTWLGLFWLRGKPTPTRDSMRFFAKYSLIGVGTFVGLLSVYMVPTGSMKAYIAMVHTYAAIYRDPQKSYCVAMGISQPTTPLGDLKVAWAGLRANFLNENAIGYLAPLVIPSAVLTFRRSKPLFLSLVLVALAALWAPTATRCQWHHYYVMSAAGVVFLLAVGADSMIPLVRTLARPTRLGGAFAVLIFTFFHFTPELMDSWNAELQRAPWQEPFPGVLDFIAKNSAPSDRILTTGPPILYTQANRVSAVRESNIIDDILGAYEGNTDQEKLRPLREEMDRHPPKIIVLDPYMEEHRIRHARALLSPFVADYHYTRAAERLYVRP